MGHNWVMASSRDTHAGPGREQLKALSTALGHRPSVLATASGPTGTCLATPEAFCVLTTEVPTSDAGQSGRGTWQVIGWENIQNGDWDNATKTLSWLLLDGTVGQIAVTTTDRLPGVFRERVRVSILVEDTSEVSEGKGSVLIAGRRNPVADGPITWTAQPLKRTNMADPEVREHIVRRTAELRDEYEL